MLRAVSVALMEKNRHEEFLLKTRWIRSFLIIFFINDNKNVPKVTWKRAAKPTSMDYPLLS